MNSNTTQGLVTLGDWRKNSTFKFDDNGSTMNHRVSMIDEVNTRRGIEVFDDCVVTFDDYVRCQKEYAARDGKTYSYELKEVLFQVKPVKEPELGKIYLELYSDLPISGKVSCRDPSHEWSVFQALNFGYFDQFDEANFREKQAVQRLLAGSYTYYISATYPMMKVAGKFNRYMTFTDDGEWIQCENPGKDAKLWWEAWDVRLNKLS